MTRPTWDRAARECQIDQPVPCLHGNKWSTGHLSADRTIGLEPLTDIEVGDLRRVGREVRAFEELAIEIMRTQMTLALMPPREDPEALRGLRRKERALLLEALSLGTEGHEELRLAAALTRCVTDDGDNLVAMLTAALETDCMRLGLAARYAHPDAPDA